jgi:hypothetical protein
VSLIVQTPPWPEHYKAPYYYAAKQLGRYSASTTARQVPYIVDVNVAPLLLSESALPQLVQVRTMGGEHMGARMLFAAMPKAGEKAYDDTNREMFNIIHDEERGGGGYEDG